MRAELIEVWQLCVRSSGPRLDVVDDVGAAHRLQSRKVRFRDLEAQPRLIMERALAAISAIHSRSDSHRSP